MLNSARFIENRSAIIVRPREPFLDWCKQTGSPESALKTFEYWRKHPRVYLVDEFRRGNERNRIRKWYWREIFASLLDGWRSETSTWPRNWTYEMFREWFEVRQVNWIADLLGEGELELQEFWMDQHAQLEDFVEGADPRAPEVPGVPSRIELNPDGCLDGHSLEKEYFGLDLRAAESLYSEGLLHRIEALRFMGPVALKYYWDAVDAYFRSEASAGDDDVLSMSCIAKRFTEPPLNQDAEVSRRVAGTVAYVLQEWSKFERNRAYFLDYRDEWERLVDLLVEQSGSS